MRQILIAKNSEGLNRQAAELFIDIANESIRRRGLFTVALSGGRTPRALFELLASEQCRNKVDWSRVRFFFGDERNVPADSSESNFHLADEALFQPLKIAPEQIFRWRTELEPTAAAEDYESAVTFAGRFDLVLLGLGEDGHIASLFPYTSAVGEGKRKAVANWVEKLNDYRLTITFPVINEAANVIVLVAGSEKAEIVPRVLEGESCPDDVPAQLVWPDSGTHYWLLDEAAAAELKRA